jgi:Zn-dependent alcohol dehydrogenase
VKSRAAVFHGAGRPLEVREIDLDEPGPRDVLVRMAAVGICGTELHSIRGEWVRPTPSVLGHEGAGVVEAVGDAVTSVKPGDEVVLSWAPSCGDCADCRRGRPAACINLHRAIGNGTLVDGTTGMTLDGETLYRGTATGCLQELITVTEQVALPLGGGVTLEEAALLGCAAMTGVGAVLFAGRTEPGDVVLIMGAGGVGQFCVQGARIAGAEAIVVVDPLEARLELARELGATHTTDPDGLKALIKEVAPDGADRALDVVGNPETSALALRFTRSGGTCVIVGIPATGERLDLDFGEFNRREKILTGTMYGSEDPAVALPILLDHLRAGRLRLRELLGQTFPLERVNEAIDRSLAGEPGRMLVLPGA